MDPLSSQLGSSSATLSRVASPELLSPSERDPDLDALIDSQLASKRVPHLAGHGRHSRSRQESRHGASKRLSDIFRRNRKRSTSSPERATQEDILESPVEERNIGSVTVAAPVGEQSSDGGTAASPTPINLVVRKRSDLTDGEERLVSDRASGSRPRQLSNARTDEQSGAPEPITEDTQKDDLLDVYDESSRQAALDQVKKLRLEVDRRYVWDVLFENQRGILFFGYPKFSAGLLMPALDPPAWTIPAHQPHAVRAHPTSSTAAQSEPPSHGALKQGHGHLDDGAPQASGGTRWNRDRNARLQRHRQSMATPYDLHTYQLPSGAWKWVTPWLINMRQDGFTDERGWEYNYFFRPRGWGSKVGRLGWGAWVRRRMWIRLRMLDEEEAKMRSFSIAGGPPQDRRLDGDILRVGKDDDEDDD